jgi:hypothetical protein
MKTAWKEAGEAAHGIFFLFFVCFFFLTARMTSNRDLDAYDFGNFFFLFPSHRFLHPVLAVFDVTANKYTLRDMETQLLKRLAEMNVPATLVLNKVCLDSFFSFFLYFP